ncbi:MAG: thioredoxin domain-containing protein, partial [Acidiferrobacterales bacterium]|nr:thioredoxin domain-containing protein [Acidiferrobacterales bacterium]
SPYLLQHAYNPVDWYPWSEEALALARRQGKPILLSIGYSACHWCHVMEHESFEDENVAAVMNEKFVCIKVDREERPDLDKIYQTAHQILVQRGGGWPLTMFLKPDDLMPFFGGTYFPKEPRHGLPGFVDVMQRVETFYREQRDALDQQSDSLADVFTRIQPQAPAHDVGITPNVLNLAYSELKQQFDPRYGGFGSAPKFPHPPSIERCLRYWAQSVIGNDADGLALHMVSHTLRAMAAGGIYDQLGGGFCRYAVDQAWTVPHFEKMLYDNAQLLWLYSDTAIATGEPIFARIACETANWALREMQAPNGGYYSTLDADSEGEEGKFYVWTTEELQQRLSAEEWSVVESRYGLKGAGNFEGKWHFNVRMEISDVAAALGLSAPRVSELLESAHAKLLQARERRVRPARDEKILTSWNGLMIRGMAKTGRLLARTEFVHSAERALDFLRAELWHDGRLFATAKDGRAHLNAYLDDYVFVLDGLLELLQVRWRSTDLELAQALADAVLAHFENKKNGGFYLTSDDHEQLIYRPIPTYDDAVPSGNGVAAFSLLRLGHLLGEPRYLDAAERTLKALHASITHAPSAHGTLLSAVEEYLFPTQTIVLRGAPEALQPWVARCQQSYAPRRQTYAIPLDVEPLPAILKEHKP